MVNSILSSTNWNEIEAIVLPAKSNSVILESLGIVECNENFHANLEEITYFYTKLKSKQIAVILVGIDEELIGGEYVRRKFGNVEKLIDKLKISNVALIVHGILEEFVNEILEGIELSNYKFDKYKSNSEKKILNIYLEVDESKYNESKLKEVNTLCSMICKGRDLVNEPSNIIYPETLANEVKKMAIESDFEVEIFEEEEIEKLGMYSFLSVAKGSDKKARLIVLRYFGDEENKDNVMGLVGKGLTYDAGGYSLKSSDSMCTMKADMAGSAVVASTISAIAKMKLKTNVVGVIAACENVLAPHSYKPGEIIKSMSGKTIEVVNTDAEGRLTLCDAITYIVRKEKVCEVIDVATLTNTVNIALGEDVAALITNNEKLYSDFQMAINKTEEKIWRMPNYNDYKRYLVSDIADIKNYGHKYGKVMTAGLFVGEFVEGRPWIHLDIAGPSYICENMDYCIKGASGFGVRTLYEFIKNR